jgi:hypothetical protein
MKNFVSRIVLGLTICVATSAASRATTIYELPYEFTITFNPTGIASIDLPAIANPLFLQDLGDHDIDFQYTGTFDAKSVSLLNSWTQDIYIEDQYKLALPIQAALANVPGPVAQATSIFQLNHTFNFATGPVQIPGGDTHLLGDASGTAQINNPIQQSTLRDLFETKQYLTFVVPVYSSTNGLIQPVGVSLINPVGGTVTAVGTLKITVIPEPSSIVLMGLGVAATSALAIYRRRRKA